MPKKQNNNQQTSTFEILENLELENQELEELEINNETKEELTIENIRSGIDEILNKHQYKSSVEETMKYAKESLEKIVKLISKEDGVAPAIVLVAIAEILQSGGHIRGVTVRKATIGSYSLTKRRITSSLMALRCQCTLRAIARANKETIAYISFKRNIYGNLYPQYKSTNPKIITENEETQLKHAIYCVDFQKDNKDAPEDVLKFLNQREIEKKMNKGKNKEKK